jgi:hypothetical protein
LLKVSIRKDKKRGKKKKEREKKEERRGKERDGNGNREEEKEKIKSECKEKILNLNHAKVTFYRVSHETLASRPVMRMKQN